MKKKYRVYANANKHKVKASRSGTKTSKRRIAAAADYSSTNYRIYLTNLSDYNNGDLNGEWVNLPVKDDFKSAFSKIGISSNDDEWFISDYETPLANWKIGEYDNIFELNDRVSELVSLDETQLMGVDALLAYGSNMDEAIEQCDNVMVYPDCDSMTDVAYEVIESQGGVEAFAAANPDLVTDYFDYDAYGRDLEINGKFVKTAEGYAEILY